MKSCDIRIIEKNPVPGNFELYIDGQPVKGCKHYKIESTAGNCPEVTITFLANTIDCQTGPLFDKE